MSVYAQVIGDPIAQSKSPVIHNFWLERLGIDAHYCACHVRDAELGAYFAGKRNDPLWRGCNVTIPHKEKVAALIDSVTAQGAAVGAINTVWPDETGKLLGTNTDVDGVREALQGISLAGRRAVVIGAGGAARAAFAHLEGVGCAAVAVLARNHDKARTTLGDFSLPAQLYPFEPAGCAFADAALVINATQLGMAGQAPLPPFIIDELADTAPDSLVFDMVYAPRATALLRRADQLGRGVSGGLTMLVGQARTAFAKFFGVLPDIRDDEDLFEMLNL